MRKTVLWENFRLSWLSPAGGLGKGQTWQAMSLY